MWSSDQPRKKDTLESESSESSLGTSDPGTDADVEGGEGGQGSDDDDNVHGGAEDLQRLGAFAVGGSLSRDNSSQEWQSFHSDEENNHNQEHQGSIPTLEAELVSPETNPDPQVPLVLEAESVPENNQRSTTVHAEATKRRSDLLSAAAIVLMLAGIAVTIAVPLSISRSSSASSLSYPPTTGSYYGDYKTSSPMMSSSGANGTSSPFPAAVAPPAPLPSTPTNAPATPVHTTRNTTTTKTTTSPLSSIPETANPTPVVVTAATSHPSTSTLSPTVSPVTPSPSATITATPTATATAATIAPTGASTTRNPQETAAPSTAQPTTSSRFDAFRSSLLNESVSSYETLSNPSSAQFQALSWLADQDQLQVAVTRSIDVIISRYVMAAIYFGNGGASWTRFDFAGNPLPYLTSGDICEWNYEGNGVYCSPLRLTLISRNVIGTLPTELGTVSSLQSLNLLDNHLKGPIPTELASLTRLTEQVFGANDLTGTIFSNLGRLTSLQSLDLSSNLLSGTIPDLGGLGLLTNLNLASNYLSGTLPNDIGQLTGLQSLNVTANFLSGTVPTILASFPNLTSLSLNFNKFRGNMTPHFCKRSWVSLVADCLSQVECSCCTLCT